MNERRAASSYTVSVHGGPSILLTIQDLYGASCDDTTAVQKSILLPLLHPPRAPPAKQSTASVYALTNRHTGFSLSPSKVVNVISLSRLEPRSLSTLSSPCILSL